MISSMSTHTQALRRRIELLKQEIVGLGDLRPGALTKQYNVCGNPRCRCKANPPQKHGPYNQLSWTRKRKSTTRFVKEAQLSAVESQVRNYERLQRLIDEWVELSIELCDLELKTDGAQRPSGEGPRGSQRQAPSA
jgi:hypothetical protein